MIQMTLTLLMMMGIMIQIILLNMKNILPQEEEITTWVLKEIDWVVWMAL